MAFQFQLFNYFFIFFRNDDVTPMAAGIAIRLHFNETISYAFWSNFPKTIFDLKKEFRVHNDVPFKATESKQRQNLI